MRRLITMLALSLSLGSSLGAHAQEQADAGSDARLDGGVDTDSGVPRVDLSTPRSTFRGSPKQPLFQSVFLPVILPPEIKAK